MARRLIIGEILNLIKGIGGNPSKFMGTKTNINFLGKGPNEGLFQGAIDMNALGNISKEMVISEAETAGGYAAANKLNDFQLQRLKDNLLKIEKIYNPPANITDLATGTGDLTQQGLGSLREATRRFPAEARQFMGRPLKDADFAKIDRLVAEGKLPPARGKLSEGETLYNKLTGLDKPRLVDLPQKTYAARATMYRLLDMEAGQGGQTLREIMSPKDLKMLLEGGGGVEGDMIAMFAKYFGNATSKQLPTATTPAVIERFAREVIGRKDAMGRGINDPFFSPEDIPFAHGGLAEILQVPRTDFRLGGFGGKFTKAQVLIQRLKNTIKGSKDKYVQETFPNFIKEIEANPELANNEAVWKALGGGLPKNQKLVVHGDDTVDFFRQTEFGPHNIENITRFIEKYPFLSREEATRILKMEPEDQILEITRLKTLFERTKNASGGLARVLEV